MHDALGVPPSTLDEFRNNTKNRPWDIRDISGDIVEFCQDQHGTVSTTHLLIHSFIHSLTHSVIHIHSFIQSFSHPYSFIHSFSHPSIPTGSRFIEIATDEEEELIFKERNPPTHPPTASPAAHPTIYPPHPNRLPLYSAEARNRNRRRKRADFQGDPAPRPYPDD